MLKQGLALQPFPPWGRSKATRDRNHGFFLSSADKAIRGPIPLTDIQGGQPPRAARAGASTARHSPESLFAGLCVTGRGAPSSRPAPSANATLFRRGPGPRPKPHGMPPKLMNGSDGVGNPSSRPNPPFRRIKAGDPPGTARPPFGGRAGPAGRQNPGPAAPSRRAAAGARPRSRPFHGPKRLGAGPQKPGRQTFTGIPT
ncbi:MAG: hypothetical protein CM15mP77_2150 [Synechococcus sp.]|nr:MAG: hypothetical protein CM15mP77_2150 [Synechococcus sp.]